MSDWKYIQATIFEPSAVSYPRQVWAQYRALQIRLRTEEIWREPWHQLVSLQKAPAHTNKSWRCHLCEETLAIITADRSITLNKRSEIVSKCRHEIKFDLYRSSHARRFLALLAIPIVWYVGLFIKLSSCFWLSFLMIDRFMNLESVIFTLPSHRDPFSMHFQTLLKFQFSAHSRLRRMSKATYNILLYINKIDCRSNSMCNLNHGQNHYFMS